MGECRLRAEVGAGQVDVDQALPERVVVVDDHLLAGDPRRVHQNVDAAELFRRSFDEAPGVVGLRHVERHRQRAAAFLRDLVAHLPQVIVTDHRDDLPRLGRSFVLSQRADDDIGAVFRHGEGDGAPHAAAAPGNCGDTSLETHRAPSPRGPHSSLLSDKLTKIDFPLV